MTRIAVLVLAAALVLAGEAGAAWSTSNTGSAYGKAGSLATPALTATANACNGANSNANLSWTTITGASAYEVYLDTKANMSSPQITSTTVTSLTNFPVENQKSYLAVRAKAGNWRGALSAVVSVC
ncbi:hypothetical protein SAMN05421504_102744 [Amycolatopsis xylanica]|uniref:Fibronectin type-III domain-containing protein n=1 Tax=Amycolatopsis xylanica TaxID=589385 RepID=A0A1H3A1G7_9PSEU|nr:hypothetical protein [Amycolatopsis xylanica]SDX23068.1 hypothetical protein SAMN05421504_102744 [Amycolatopsis xylanica]